jgi:hypothetical protein
LFGDLPTVIANTQTNTKPAISSVHRDLIIDERIYHDSVVDGATACVGVA